MNKQFFRSQKKQKKKQIINIIFTFDSEMPLIPLILMLGLWGALKNPSLILSDDMLDKFFFIMNAGEDWNK